MSTKLDSRQITYSGSLLRVATTNPTELDNIIASLDAESTPPLMMRADPITARVVDIGGIVVTNPETGERRTIPPINGISPTFTNGTIQFPVSGNNTVTVTPGIDPTMPPLAANQFMKVGVYLNDSGNIELSFGTAGASEALAGDPPDIVRTFALGYIVISADGVGAINDVAQADVVMYAGGGGGGGGGLVTEYQNSAFTAEVGKHYLVDTSGGQVAITLPDGGEGDVIRFSDATKSWATNKIVITPDGSDSIDGDTAGVAFDGDTDAGWMLLAFDNTNSNWIVDAPGINTGGTGGGGGGGTGLTTSLATSSPVTAVNNTHYLVRSSGSPITVNLPLATGGEVIRVSDESGNSNTYNITIAPFAGQTIDGDTSFVIDVNNGWVQLSWTGDDWTVDTLSANDSSGILSLNGLSGSAAPTQTFSSTDASITFNSSGSTHDIELADTIAGARAFSGAVTLSGGVSGDFAVNTNQIFNDSATGKVAFGTSVVTDGRITFAFPANEKLVLGDYNNVQSGNLTAHIGRGTSLVWRADQNPRYSSNENGEVALIKAEYDSSVSDGESGSHALTFHTFFGWYLSGSLTEKMRIDSSGNVGIGTTSPANRLDIRNQDAAAVLWVGEPNIAGLASTSPANTSKLVLSGIIGASAEYGGIEFFRAHNNSRKIGAAIIHERPSTSLDQSDLVFKTSNTNADATERGRINHSGSWTIGPSGGAQHTVNGNIDIVGTVSTSAADALDVRNSSGTQMLQVRNDNLVFINGLVSITTANAANMWTSPTTGQLARSTASSARFKNSVQDLTAALDKVKALRPVTFKYNEGYYQYIDRVFAGFLAEEVKEVDPLYVDFENEDGTGEVENVRYANLTALLVKAIQELKAELDEAKARIQTLEGGA